MIKTKMSFTSSNPSRVWVNNLHYQNAWATRHFIAKNGNLYPNTPHFYSNDPVGPSGVIHDTLHHIKEIRCDNHIQEEFRALGVALALHGSKNYNIDYDARSVARDHSYETQFDYFEEKCNSALWKEFLNLIRINSLTTDAPDGPGLKPLHIHSLYLGYVTGRHRYGEEFCPIFDGYAREYLKRDLTAWLEDNPLKSKMVCKINPFLLEWELI